MVILGFEIGELLAAALRYRHLRFCIKIILKGIQKSEITDCDTRGCGMWGKSHDHKRVRICIQTVIYVSQIF
jgi:hypothetical protein